HRHAEAPHAGTAAEIPARRSPANAPTLPRRQDGAVLAPGQGGRRHLPDERGLCGRSGPAPQGTPAYPGRPDDLRPAARRPTAAARHADEIEVAHADEIEVAPGLIAQ